MKKITIRFLSSALVLCICGISAAFAAPTVKRLGSNTVRLGSNATTVTAPTTTKSTGNTEAQRLSGVRAVSSSGSIPTKRVINSSTSGNDTNRLGFKIGPYLQTGSGVRPVQQTSETQQSEPTPVSEDLLDRIEDLERDVEELKNEVYTGDEWILIDDHEISLNPSVIQRIGDLEENKQDNLSVGDGLLLDENSHLTLNLEALNLPELTYTGTYGITVDEPNRQVKLDISDPVENAIYVFQNGAWTQLQIREQWDLNW